MGVLITARGSDFFVKKNKRGGPFIRDLRVTYFISEGDLFLMGCLESEKLFYATLDYLSGLT